MKTKNQLKKEADRILAEDRRKNKKNKGLHKFADNLRNNIPKSEKWLIDYLEQYGVCLFSCGFKSNMVFKNKYIPDFINYDSKVIIEVDDRSHNYFKQKIKDRKKDAFYTSKGFDVIRITHKDTDGADIALSSIGLGKLMEKWW